MNSEIKILPASEVFIDIPFFDVDDLGVAWHGDYTKYLEIACGTLMDTGKMLIGTPPDLYATLGINP